MPVSTGVIGSVQDVSLNARDGVRLEASYLPSHSDSATCVMVLHGVADSRVGALGFASMFLEAGYSVLAPDSRAHGRSGGDLVTYGLLEKYDVLDWAEWLSQTGCTKLYGLGESLGGAVLIQASAEAPVFRAIAAEAVFSDLQSVAEYRVARMAGGSKALSGWAARWVVASGMLYARVRYGFRFGRVSPEKCLQRSRTPTLLIHGDQDFETPSSHSVQMSRMNPSAALWLVAGAPHCGAASVSGAKFRFRVLDWFSRH